VSVCVKARVCESSLENLIANVSELEDVRK